MTTKVYGTSDDLIEIDGDAAGDFAGEVGIAAEGSSLLMFSDGTLLEIGYGKGELAVWWINVLRAGELFRNKIVCDDPDAQVYSDVVPFSEGLKWAYHSKNWERVK